MPATRPNAHRFHPRSSAFIGGALLLAVAGCSGYPGPRSIVNEDPAIKIPQMRRAVDARDRSAVPQLLTDLDSDDAAVRFYAIQSLRRLTGQTHGYDWTLADHHDRAAAIARWRDALGTPGALPDGASTTPSAGASTRTSGNASAAGKPGKQS